jgi:dihydrofolate reductase
MASVSYSEDIESVFVIGGAAAFEEALSSQGLDKVYLTEVMGDIECDTFVTGHASERLQVVAKSVRTACVCHA